MIADFFAWLLSFIAGIVAQLVGPVVSALTPIGTWNTTIIASLGPYSTYVAAANAWFPIDIAFDTFAALFSFWCVVQTFKFVKSCIPSVSGNG